MTYPPPTYPPTAPYASLTTHYKNLVKEGRLHRYLVKALLYSDYYYHEYDTSAIVYRGRHKITGRRARSHTPASQQTSNTTTTTTASHSLQPNKSEFDEVTSSSDGSCASSAFGYMEFKTGKTTTCTAPSTDYETFIDYGESADCTKKMFDELSSTRSHKSSVLINRDSDGSFIFPSAKKSFCSVESRDSLPIHSKPIKLLLAAQTPSRESVIHTSTARLHVSGGKIKQQNSQISHTSGFDQRLNDAHMACENLLNLDDSMKFKNPLVKRATMEDRHSMPTLFVGNRFNSSDVTEVYIPAYKDKNELQTSAANRPAVKSRSSTPDSTSTTTHSSSIDLPAMVPAPDQITAELLYNFPNLDTYDEHTTKDIIKPPSMFDNSRRISLNREISPFKKHSINSDKRILSRDTVKQQKTKINDLKVKTQQTHQEQQKLLKDQKCISYQFVKLRDPNSVQPSSIQQQEVGSGPLYGGGSSSSKKCTCCSSSRCPSPRSSDSGMAGSCTISSPDPSKDKPYSPFDTEFLDHLHKHGSDGRQHNISSGNERCTRYSGGGGSIGGGSGGADDAGLGGSIVSKGNLRHSSSSHNFGRFDVVSFNKDNNHDSGQFGDSSSLNKEDGAADEDGTDREDGLSVTHIQNMFELSTSRDTVRRETRAQSAERLYENTAHNDPRYVMEIGNDAAAAAGDGVYSTGLYAHWWKKETLPGAMLRDLIVQKYNRDRERLTSCRQNIGWGSGKRFSFSNALFLFVIVEFELFSSYFFLFFINCSFSRAIIIFYFFFQAK